MRYWLTPFAILAISGLLTDHAHAAVLSPHDIYRIDFTTDTTAWTTDAGCGFGHAGPPPCPPDTLTLTFFGDSVFNGVTGISLDLFSGQTLVGTGLFIGDFNVSPIIALTTESSPLSGLPFVSRVSDELWHDSVLVGCINCRAEFRILSGTLLLDEDNLEFTISRAERTGGGTFWVDGWFTVTRQAVVPEPPKLLLLLLGFAVLGVLRRRYRAA